MNTLFMTVVGLIFSAILCSILSIAFALGYAEPNVIPEDGQTYLGWWVMLIGCSTVAFTIWGIVFDIVGTIQYMIRKS
jgi:uncharacterized membrane protein YbhN (UPF0104 family)